MNKYAAYKEVFDKMNEYAGEPGERDITKEKIVAYIERSLSVCNKIDGKYVSSEWLEGQKFAWIMLLIWIERAEKGLC